MSPVNFIFVVLYWILLINGDSDEIQNIVNNSENDIKNGIYFNNVNVTGLVIIIAVIAISTPFIFIMIYKCCHYKQTRGNRAEFRSLSENERLNDSNESELSELSDTK